MAPAAAAAVIASMKEQEKKRWQNPTNNNNNRLLLLSTAASQSVLAMLPSVVLFPFDWKSHTNRFKTGIQRQQHTECIGT